MHVPMRGRMSAEAIASVGPNREVEEGRPCTFKLPKPAQLSPTLWVRAVGFPPAVHLRSSPISHLVGKARLGSTSGCFSYLRAVTLEWGCYSVIDFISGSFTKYIFVSENRGLYNKLWLQIEPIDKQQRSSRTETHSIRGM